MKLLGVSNLQIGNHEAAITYLQNALEESSDSETICYYLGHAYRNNGDFEKSAYYFGKAIRSGISDNISEYYTNLAIVYEQTENYAESIKAYQAAYRSSKNKILLYHLARNYDLYYEDKKTALNYYKKYLALNDSDNLEFMDYSKHRINELKNVMHFNIDSIE